MIEVQGLYFSYSGKENILKGLDFTVKKGEIFGFLGPNGAGKSTTQKILTGILGGYEGEVSINGYKMKKVSREFYQSIGVLFEMPYLYSTLNAVDNLKYFASFYKQDRIRDIHELLDLVELQEDYRNRLVKDYSKGMKQRTSLARVLMNNPEILFLDEPVSGVDPSGAVLIKNIIKREKEKGRTIFLTTHNMYVADELCDRVAFLVDGEIKLIENPKVLKSSHAEKEVELEYLKEGKREQKKVKLEEFKPGLDISYEEIISIHTKEDTLEDIFVRLTGRGLD